MYTKHLPPSAGVPRVLALDRGAAEELQGAADVSGPAKAGTAGEPYDAVAGSLAPEPEALDALWKQLRPGGRVILTAAEAEPEALLEALVKAGFIHCLVEPAGALTLCRGERPPAGSSLERHERLAEAGAALPRYLFLLIIQTPNTPAWKLQPGDEIEWHAATRLDAGGQPKLLAFSSLPKAVAFMQRAILAGMLPGVNKLGKFPASAAQGWPAPLLLNPDLEQVRSAAAGAPLRVDPHAAEKDEG